MIHNLNADDSTFVNNYRPVSLLCGFAKVSEKVVHNRVYFHLNSMISEVQHGLLKNKRLGRRQAGGG